MNHSKLRIAWSLAWGMVAVLLLVLWVRSNYRIDQFNLPIGQQTTVAFISVPNAVGVGAGTGGGSEIWGSDNATEWLTTAHDDNGTPWSEQSKFQSMDGGLLVPAWFAVLAAATIAAAPWARFRRFS